MRNSDQQQYALAGCSESAPTIHVARYSVSPNSVASFMCVYSVAPNRMTEEHPCWCTIMTSLGARAVSLKYSGLIRPNSVHSKLHKAGGFAAAD
mmetsp:Transcript_107400/g.213222  ORF Transcript_107400/g.213222 Transcript_107400/m.213222 type:complete len:94 (-) Transcript_107400:121-402(-)